ncbi:MAG TPA: Fe-S-containing protein [Nitrospirota bacterium]
MPACDTINIRTALAAAFMAALILMGCSGGRSGGERIKPVDGVFSIDTAGFAPGDVRSYRYDTGGKAIVFLVARTRGGEFKTAFDACVTCYPYKKGYECREGRVVCRQCGTAFELDELGAGKGNCIPIQIEHSLRDGKLMIDRAVIEEGVKLF